MRPNNRGASSLVVLLAFAAGSAAQPVSSAFTYQGELRSGASPAAGLHDLRFRLYDAELGGSQVGPTVCGDNISVSNGRFTLPLDFGPVFAGQGRYLEIDVRVDAGLSCASSAGFVTLGPRQAVTAAPHASFALSAANATTAQTSTNATNAVNATTATTAANATQLGGQSAAFYLDASNLATGVLGSARLGGTYSGLLTLSNPSNAFSGSGAGLTGLNASGISSGTLADARLSANVALLSAPQTVTGVLTFSAAPAFTGAGAPFTVSGGGVVTNLNADRLDGMDASAFLTSVPAGTVVSGNNATHILRAENSSATFNSAAVLGVTTGNAHGVRGESVGMGGVGVSGVSPGTGVFGSSSGVSGRGVWGSANEGVGVYGQSSVLGGIGVLGRGPGTAVFGEADASGGTGVYGEASASSGSGVGVRGTSSSPNGTGVSGLVTLPTGTSIGGRFETAGNSGKGVYGRAYSGSGATFGGLFESESTGGRGVHGLTSANSGITYAVFGIADSTDGRGAYGFASALSGPTYGVYGRAVSPSGYSVYANGVFGATGIKAFRIDHPDDPTGKYLMHYSAESPEVINFYRGTVTLDGNGEMMVELPAYFGKVNADPSYQLTAVGAAMPMLHVAEEVDPRALEAGAAAGPDDAAPICRFKIAGGLPGRRVSWRVEAARNDAWMRAHGAPVEVAKPGAERGTYQLPELYGQPASMGIDSGAAFNRDSRRTNP